MERNVGRRLIFPTLVEMSEVEGHSWGDSGVREYRIDWENFDFMKDYYEKKFNTNIKLPQIYEELITSARFHIPDLNLCEIFRQWNMAISKYHAPTMYCSDTMEIDISYESANMCINYGFNQITRFVSIKDNNFYKEFGNAYLDVLRAAIKTKFWNLLTGGGNLPKHAQIQKLKELCSRTTTIIEKDGTKNVYNDLDESIVEKVKDFIDTMHAANYFNLNFDKIPVKENLNFTIDKTYMID